VDQANRREPTPTDCNQRPDHGIGAKMDDERPNRGQPDSRADDRNEPHAFASHDGLIPAQAMIEAAKSRGFGKLAGRTARLERLAECLWHRNVRRRGVLLHYLADILVDLADIDDVYPGFGG